METTSDSRTNTDTSPANGGQPKRKVAPTPWRILSDTKSDLCEHTMPFDGTAMDPKTTRSNSPLTSLTILGRHNGDNYKKDNNSISLQVDIEG